MFQELSLTLLKNADLLDVVMVETLFILPMVFLYKKFIHKDERTFTFLKWKMSDIWWMVFLTVTYGILCFWRLGSTVMPQTTWQPTADNETIILKAEQPFDTVYVLPGEGDNNANPYAMQFGMNGTSIYGSNDLNTWDSIHIYDQVSYLAYQITYTQSPYTYLKIVTTNRNIAINEVGLKEVGTDHFADVSVWQEDIGDYPDELLIDEQDKLVTEPTWYDETYFDEIYHPRNAKEIAEGQYMYSSVHPLFGTTLMAFGIKVFGMNPFGWRFMGALAGSLLSALFYILARTLFNQKAAVMSTFLFNFDFMHLTTSRIGTLEPFSLFFILLMNIFMVFYAKDETHEKRWLALSGISMGLAWSTKWTGLYSSIGLAIVFFIAFFTKWARKEDKPRYMISTGLWCVLWFVIIPVIIYFASFIITPVWRDGYSIANVISHNQYMFDYHRNLQATHPFQSVWYEWLLDLKPIWYYVSYHEQNIRTISCFSNPFINWAGIAALVYTGYKAIRNRSYKYLFIVISFLSALLPWVTITRCVFAYHFYPSVPFMILAIGAVFDDNRTLEKCGIYFVPLCGIVFVLFLPVLNGSLAPLGYVRDFLTWIGGWYFG